MTEQQTAADTHRIEDAHALVEKLEAPDYWMSSKNPGHDEAPHEAAEFIRLLRTEVERLTHDLHVTGTQYAKVEADRQRMREALEPFAKVGRYMRHTPGVRSVSLHYNAVEADGLNSRGSAGVAVSDFLRAASCFFSPANNQPEVPWLGTDCDCGADPYKDGGSCRDEHDPDCPATLAPASKETNDG